MQISITPLILTLRNLLGRRCLLCRGAVRKGKGTTDQGRVNDGVNFRDGKIDRTMIYGGIANKVRLGGKWGNQGVSEIGRSVGIGE